MVTELKEDIDDVKREAKDVVAALEEVKEELAGNGQGDLLQDLAKLQKETIELVAE